MIVKCLGNRRDFLKGDEKKAYFSEFVHLDRVHLEIGKTYLVSGIVYRKGQPWYLVCEDEYPKPHFADFFEIVDGRLPPDWSFSTHSEMGDSALLPTRWAQRPRFYEQLVEGQAEACALFEELTRAMRHWHALELDAPS